MKDIEVMLPAARAELAAGRPVVLATVVKLVGSGYRRPGARLLVRADGSRVGAISGGCLEADVAERARKVMETGRPALASYDGRSGLDPVVEMGCTGSIGILIEPVTGATLKVLEFLAGFDQQRGRGALATVFRVKGDCPAAVGDRWMRREHGRRHGTLRDPRLVAEIGPFLEDAIQEGEPVTRAVMLADAEVKVEVLCEPVQSRISLVLCGAGYDAVPLARMAGSLGWQVTVADHRDSLLNLGRFPGGVALLSDRRKHSLVLDDRTAVVIMTHSYERDLGWLRFLLPSPAGYLGLLGPRKRCEQMQQDLHAEGWRTDSGWVSRLYGPAGLNLGAETAEEIALSIAAEIQAVFSDRGAGFLRDRLVPIHAPSLLEQARGMGRRSACAVLA